jgi:hypothetical protein
MAFFDGETLRWTIQKIYYYSLVSRVSLPGNNDLMYQGEPTQTPRAWGKPASVPYTLSLVSYHPVGGNYR